MRYVGRQKARALGGLRLAFARLMVADDDQLRKEDPDAFNPEEDFAGAPAGASYFVLSKERDERGRPLRLLTRQEARAEAAQREAESDSVLSGFKQTAAEDEARRRIEDEARFEERQDGDVA